MNRSQLKLLSGVPTLALGFLALACSDPTMPNIDGIPVEEEEICESSDNWLPDTPELPQFLPVPHPAGECPFYRSAWQNFLRAMQPDSQGVPALMRGNSGFATIDEVFEHAVAHPTTRAYLGDIKQAGGRQILIDGNGNTLYYGIHVNDAFADFIHKYGFQSADALKTYADDHPGLTFPAGLVETKSAWQVIESGMDTSDYITMTTTVPTISQDASGAIHEDRDTPRTVQVRLLAIHIVSTLVGHPEFIWGSMEHSKGFTNGKTDTGAHDFQRDVAPILAADVNPTDDDPLNQNVDTAPSDSDHVLYKGGTPANLANKAFRESELTLVGQKFMDGGEPQQTSIYRMFPASKSNTTDPDAAITSLNHNVEALFKDVMDSLPSYDKRMNYRLLGAQWMDKPRYYENDIPIQNNELNPMVLGPHIDQNGDFVDHAIPLDEFKDAIVAEGSDSEFSILAGEDRMSSTAMESFTQQPGSFNNCFTCHNTQAITTNGIPTARDNLPGRVQLLPAGLLNVSHILSQFLLEEFEDARAGTAP